MLLLSLYILLALLALIGLRVRGRGFVDDCFDRRQTDAVKGFFIGCVFISHLSGYFEAQGISPGRLFAFLNGRVIGQAMVAAFLFYSGYGVMRAIGAKGLDYVKALPRRRIFATLVKFDAAVAVFFVVNLLIGREMSVREVLLSITGWVSIGNSNWYIFDILCCYALTWAAARVLPRRAVPWAVLVLTAGLMGVLALTQGKWWYSTLLCYPAGVFVGCWRDAVEAFAKRFYGWLLAGVGIALVPGMLWSLNGWVYNLHALAVVAAVVLVSLKATLRSPVLVWMGAHLFPIYIYQRIPMNVLSAWHGGELVRTWPFVFVGVSLVVTAVIAAWLQRERRVRG